MRGAGRRWRPLIATSSRRARPCAAGSICCQGYCNVVSAAVIKEPGSNRSKGFGFVEMSSQSEAQKAISMFNGYSLNDRQLTVNIARPREERGGGGFRPGGGRGGFRDNNRGGGRDRRR